MQSRKMNTPMTSPLNLNGKESDLTAAVSIGRSTNESHILRDRNATAKNDAPDSSYEQRQSGFRSPEPPQYLGREKQQIGMEDIFGHENGTVEKSRSSEGRRSGNSRNRISDKVC